MAQKEGQWELELGVAEGGVLECGGLRLEVGGRGGTRED